MQPELPTGTVTFLFTDIEGSTRLLRELGDGYADGACRASPCAAGGVGRHGGVEVDTAGRCLLRRVRACLGCGGGRRLRAARARERARCGCGWGCIRGSRFAADEGYVGFDVHRAARIAAAGHGGQVLLSQATADLAGVDVRDLGLHRLKDLSAPERLFQLGTEGFRR